MNNGRHLRLTKFEVVASFAVWIGHAAYAWYLVWSMRDAYAVRLWNYGSAWSATKDDSNFEWLVWTSSLPRYGAALLLHTVSLALVDRAKRSQANKILLTLWLFANVIAYGVHCVITSLAMGLIFCLVKARARRASALWTTAVLMFFSLNLLPRYQRMGQVDHYAFCVFFTYKLLQYLSFFLTTLHDEQCEQAAGVMDLALYTLYPPYSTVMFVTYERFRLQWALRPLMGERDWWSVACLIVKVAFWTVVAEWALHFFYMNAMMQDVEFLELVPVDKLCAVVYTAGQYFHVKYVAIFGLFKVFALADGMRPAQLPVCISRVALYSRVWRHFDNGLYEFLSAHIFRPMVELTKDRVHQVVGRLLAGAACFLFVWLFHGQSSAFGVWALMNFFEVTLEKLGAYLDRRWHLINKSVATLGPWTTRRLMALVQMPCVVLSVYSIVFFLGGYQTGLLVIRRTALGLNYAVQPVFLYLLGLGYFFIHCCIEVEHLVQQRGAMQIFDARQMLPLLRRKVNYCEEKLKTN